MREIPFGIRTAAGDLVRGDLRYGDGHELLPAVIVCHGFTAHKNWGPFPYIGRTLAELGFASLTINFSHNGIGSNFRKFTEIEKFSRNTVGRELADVQGILAAISAREIGSSTVDPGRIAILGHSRGAGIAILSARADRRIKAVAAWATIATFHRYTAHQREMWEAQGFLPVTIKGAQTKLRFGLDVLRDLEANRAAYDLKAAVSSLEVPLLLVHGMADVSVRPSEPEELLRVSDRSKTEYVLLEGAGHMFGATHPYHGNSPVLNNVVELTARWLHTVL
ncbi:MAG TPA: alpha/beta fold hydrolase [Bacteroidota bacterium]|nr:alpha/beta fold hydrolase [Bacteroidota bacterium]